MDSSELARYFCITSLQNDSQVLDEHVLLVLRSWKHSRKVGELFPSALNSSESAGCEVFGYEGQGCSDITRVSRTHMWVARLLNVWIKGKTAKAGFPQDLAWNSITVARDLQTGTRRGEKDDGIQIMYCLGDFQKGGLSYWADSTPGESLNATQGEEASVVQTMKRLILFDSKRKHAHDSFEGEKHTILFQFRGSSASQVEAGLRDA